MRVLGIDPGTAACGYAIVHESDGRLRALDHGWWQTPARERPELRLKTIFEGVQELVEQHEPDAVALEESFVGADARTALSVGQARGAALVAAALAGVGIARYYVLVTWATVVSLWNYLRRGVPATWEAAEGTRV